MVKKQENKLLVKAVETANVNEIGTDGRMSIGNGQPRRIVGKVWNKETEHFDIVAAGVSLHYRPEYIKHIKEKALLPANLETSLLAGVPWESSSSNKENK